MAAPAKVVAVIFNFKLMIFDKALRVRHLYAMAIRAETFPMALVAPFDIKLCGFWVQVRPRLRVRDLALVACHAKVCIMARCARFRIAHPMR